MQMAQHVWGEAPVGQNYNPKSKPLSVHEGPPVLPRLPQERWAAAHPEAPGALWFQH